MFLYNYCSPPGISAKLLEKAVQERVCMLFVYSFAKLGPFCKKKNHNFYISGANYNKKHSKEDDVCLTLTG